MNVLITGANGFIGTNLIKRILADTDWSVTAIVPTYEDMEKTGCDFPKSRVEVIENQAFFANECPKADAAVNLAFSRRDRGEADIAGSIDYSARVFKKLAKANINNVIFVSSQSVYGITEELRSEKTQIAPNSVYSMAKYAAEKVFENVFSDLPHINRTCIRLDSVVQSQRLVGALCQQAKSDRHINLVGGNQVFSYIDIEDAVSAFMALLSCDKWERVYNVGLNNSRITLMELAKLICEISEKHNNGGVTIDLTEKDIVVWAGMDSSLFLKDTGWKPKYTMYDMVEKIYLKS